MVRPTAPPAATSSRRVIGLSRRIFENGSPLSALPGSSILALLLLLFVLWMPDLDGACPALQLTLAVVDGEGDAPCALRRSM